MRCKHKKTEMNGVFIDIICDINNMPCPNSKCIKTKEVNK